MRGPHVPAEALEEAHAAKPVEDLGAREDLRDLPLVTIDPVDARDHDDAVCAAPDDDPKNPDGHVVWVAIADVAHYVRPDSALDHEARARGKIERKAKDALDKAGAAGMLPQTR